jgi:hypothetical protein
MTVADLRLRNLFCLMSATLFSEMSVDFERMTRRYMPEHATLGNATLSRFCYTALGRLVLVTVLVGSSR